MPIPSALSELWEFLNSEVLSLHERWIIYRQVYGTNPERIDLVNKAASGFFAISQRVLMNDVQLTLIKLAEESQKNATLGRLVSEVRRTAAGKSSAALSNSLIKLRQSCQKIKDRRDKDIAHFGLSVQLGNKASVLPGPSRQEIEEALTELRTFMNTFLLLFGEPEMAYEHFILQSDGDTLIFTLKKALRYEQLQSAGTIPYEDILQSPYHRI